MKILHIIDSGGLYGAEIMLLNLVAEQVAQGLNPAIASIGEKNIPEKDFEKEAIHRGFKIKAFRMAPGPNIFGALKILRYARKEGFDVLHSHGYKSNILLGFMPKAFRRLPIVSTLHGYTEVNGFSKLKIYEWTDLLSHRFIDKVVLVNKGMLDNPKLKNRSHVHYHVINNGIPVLPDSAFFDESALDPDVVQFCEGGHIIGSIGRLSPEKGYAFLIEAFALVIKGGMDARLIIIGEGSERDHLEKLIKKMGLSKQVFMPGYLRNAQRYLPLMKVYVIPSLTEGLPLTLLEAMQAKIPVVASRVGGIPDVLDGGKAGLLTQPGAPEALAGAIIRFLHDKDFREKTTHCAYQKFMSHYSSDTMAAEYLKLYKNLL